jgi:hypothetical protein
MTIEIKSPIEEGELDILLKKIKENQKNKGLRKHFGAPLCEVFLTS